MVSLNPTSICTTYLYSLFNKVQKQINGKGIGFTKKMVLRQLNIYRQERKKEKGRERGRRREGGRERKEIRKRK